MFANESYGALGLGGLAGFGLGVAPGAREIEDDLRFGFEFVFDGGEGAKKQAAGIGHDGAAAGGDFVGGEEFVEFSEDVVDVHGGVKFPDAADERFGEVAGGFLEADGGVAEAEA